MLDNYVRLEMGATNVLPVSCVLCHGVYVDSDVILQTRIIVTVNSCF